MNFQELFKLGMKRDIGELKLVEGPSINLGGGDQEVPGAINFDLPGWDADHDPLPCAPGTISTVHAYHFLEHVTDPINMLREIERILKPGGVCNIVVPYYKSQMAYHDLEHKSFWTEETWKNLFETPYDRVDNKWYFKINFNLICGIVERNLCLVTQLEKAE